MKLVLANTPLKVGKLLKKFEEDTGWVGIDTEVSAPMLQGRDFINITYAALLGVSIAFEDEQCFYLPIRHKGNNASFLDLHHVLTSLQELAKQGRAWAHNAKFDHQVFIRQGYPMEGLYDSMVAAWLCEHKNKGIGLKQLAFEHLNRESPEFDPTIGTRTAAEVLEYACHDALNTLQLGQYYTPQLSEEEFRWFKQECLFAHSLAEMKLAGINLDRHELRLIRDDAEKVRAAALAKWEALAPDISITSSKQLQALYQDGTWRRLKQTRTGAFATDAETVRQQLDYGSERGKELARLRLDFQEVSKIVNTYTDGLIEEAMQWSDKKLHPDLFHFGTVTGRLSSSHPNIQNQPSHGDWAKRIKQCYIPDPGFEFTSADYSQIELRYFADYCGGALLDAFLHDKDLHQETADGLGIDRARGKTVNFGFLLYGGGANKMATLLGTDKKGGQAAIAALNAKYPRIEKWRKYIIDRCKVRTPLPWVKTRAGRVRVVPELAPLQWKALDPVGYHEGAKALGQKYGISLTSINKMYLAGRSEFELDIDAALYNRGRRLLVNYIIQGGSRDLLVIGMNRYREAAPEGFSLVTTVHDEVLTQHQVGRGEEGRALLKSALEGAGKMLGLKVPIIAEPKTGSSWQEVK